MKSSEQPGPDQPMCTICLQNQPTCSLNNCPHTFCFRCIKRWSRTKNTCPLCRRRFSRMRHRNQVIEVVRRRGSRAPPVRAPGVPPPQPQRRMLVWPVGVMVCGGWMGGGVMGVGGLVLGQPMIGFPVMMSAVMPQ